MNFVLYTFQVILRKIKKMSEKKLSKKFCQHFFEHFFSIFLKYSETHFDLVASKIGAKLNFSSTMFVKKLGPRNFKFCYTKKINVGKY